MGRPRTRYPTLPPLDLLRSLFEYDPHTGSLIRRTSIRGGGPQGTEAGSIIPGRNSRRWVQIRGNQYDAAVIAYALGTNTLPGPRDSVFHLDGDRSNNALGNLRLQQHTQATPIDPLVEQEMEEWL